MKKFSNGFTLIEVVLVMAIAGLLASIVLLAVGGARRSREDNQRKNSLAIIATKLDTYASNNQGKYPSTAEVNDPNSTFRKGYDTLKMLDPRSGTNYVFEPEDTIDCSSTAPNTDHGPGFIRYENPGAGGAPYSLRMCLSQGEYRVTQ